MNIESVFNSLDEDEMNSALGTIVSSLEKQGYTIEIEGIQVTAEEILENKLPSLEEVLGPLNFILYKEQKQDQKFAIDFTDYHEIVFMKYKRRK